MASAEAVARYFLWLAASEAEEDPVTHMRLQKLLYYAQGWALASREEPLFDAAIKAGQHGPAGREVSPRFPAHGSRPLPNAPPQEPSELSERDRALVQWVWQMHGRFTASELRRQTHSEPPWLTARGDL